MKNIYVCGDVRSIYVRDYTEWVLQKPDGERNILFLHEPSDQDVYRADNIQFLLDKPPTKKGMRSVLEGWKISASRRCRKMRPDAFVIHFVNPWTIIRYYSLWKAADRRILVFWGSDLYRITGKNVRLLRKYLPMATALVFVEEHLRCEFRRQFGEQFVSKEHLIDFGMPLADGLERLLKEGRRDECRSRFGIPDGRICVHVGYNGSDAQEHTELMARLSELPEAVKSRLYLVIPFNYAVKSAEYLGKVKAALAGTGIDGHFETDFFDKEKTAAFRNTCDIFLYGQRTDAGSYSPIEYMYMGSRAVMPKWLVPNYLQLDAVGYEYDQYSDFDEIPGIMIKNTEDCEKGVEPAGLEGFRSWIKENKSWEKLAPKWREILI